MAGANPILTVLADADRSFRSVLRWLLESDGRFEVVLDSGSGDDVMACPTADLALVDLSVSGTDALTAVSNLLGRLPALVAVILSPADVPYLRAAAAESGAQGFLAKSSDLDESLPARLHDLVGQHRQPCATGGYGDSWPAG